MFSERAQFEAVTLVVWLFFLVLVIAIGKRWNATRDMSLGLLPVFHLLPWAAGLIEYRRMRNRDRMVQGNPTSSGEGGVSPLQSLIRILWAAYSTILFLDAVIVWR
jgi:hypothetical protein